MWDGRNVTAMSAARAAMGPAQLQHMQGDLARQAVPVAIRDAAEIDNPSAATSPPVRRRS
jgi:hypothetical protein